MLPSERMARRVELVDELTRIDERLVAAFESAPAYRAAEATRGLLCERREVRELMREVGFQAWRLPVDLPEAEAV